MHAFKLLVLAPLAVASALQPRQSSNPGTQQILQSITNIDTAVHSLIDALNTYTGGINASLPIFGASLNIHRVNREGFAANQKVAGPLSSADSKQVDQRVNDTVAVSIPAATKILEHKKPLFDEAELSSVVLSTINLLRGDHESFSLVVGSKLSLDAVPGGLGGAGKIEAVLVEASLIYSV